MRLRNRPWKLVFGAIAGTLALVVAGVDLLDGKISLRRYGIVSAAEDPGTFGVYVFGYLLSSAFIVFLWLIIRDEWPLEYRISLKPRFDDPEKSRHYTPAQRTQSLPTIIGKDAAKR